MYFKLFLLYSQTGATVPLKPKSSCHALPNQCGSGNLWWYSKGGKRQHLDLIYLVKLGSRVHSRVGSRRVLCFKKSLGNCCLNKIFVFLMHEKNKKTQLWSCCKFITEYQSCALLSTLTYMLLPGLSASMTITTATPTLLEIFPLKG